MERLHEQGVDARLDVDVADCAHGHAPAGIELVQHAFMHVLLAEFVLECPKNFRIGRFQLEANLIVDAAAALDAIGPLALQPRGKQPSAFGQGMVRRGGHFGERQSAVVPGYDVARAGDVDFRFIFLSFDDSRLIDFEKLRMQRPPIYLEDKFGDFRSRGDHRRFSLGVDNGIGIGFLTGQTPNVRFPMNIKESGDDTFIISRLTVKFKGRFFAVIFRFRCRESGLTSRAIRVSRLGPASKKADDNVVGGMGSGGDSKAPVDEQQAEKHAGDEAEGETEQLRSFALRADVMGGGKQHAR